MNSFAPYELGLIMLGIFALEMAILNFTSGVIKNGIHKQIDPEKAEGGYHDLPYRAHRTYMNSVENAAPIFGAGFVGVMLGANAFWLNLLITIIVSLRILHAVLYYFKIGKMVGGPRTFVHVASVVLTIILAIVAVI